MTEAVKALLARCRRDIERMRTRAQCDDDDMWQRDADDLAHYLAAVEAESARVVSGKVRLQRGGKMRAWHFLREEYGVPVYHDGSAAKVGDRLRHNGLLVMCESGLHASERLIDALQYAPGSWICDVECGGETEKQADKLVCRDRTILRMANIDRELHEFACWCADRALKLIPNPDPRSVAAVEAKRKWFRGEITDEELAAERDASAAERDASAAARDAASAAAWDAERDDQNAELLRVVMRKLEEAKP